MTAEEWLLDVIAAASTLGYRVDAISWADSTVSLSPSHHATGETITIRSLFLSGAYLLTHLRPVNEARLVALPQP